MKCSKTDKMEPEETHCVSPAMKPYETIVISTKSDQMKFDNSSPTNSRNAPTPLANIWNPMFSQNCYQNGYNFDTSPSSSVPALTTIPSNPFSIYPPLTDWIYPRPYPLFPMTAAPWWVCQKNFGLFI